MYMYKYIGGLVERWNTMCEHFGVADLLVRAHWWCVVFCSVVQCGAVCCCVVQCGAVWCSAVQCGALCRGPLVRACWWCVAVCCSVLQYTVVWCRVRWISLFVHTGGA